MCIRDREWDLQHVEEDEEPRPEFEASVKTFRMNPVTRRREPYIPTLSKAIRFAATGSMVFFMVINTIFFIFIQIKFSQISYVSFLQICVVLSAVLGTIIYRISIVTVIYEGGLSLIHIYHLSGLDGIIENFD